MTKIQDQDDIAFREFAVKELRLLDVDDISKILGRKVSSIRSDASRCPQSLPPIVRVPGARRLLWRRNDVEAWLAGHVVQPAPLPTALTTSRRRGRPRKNRI